tara:strand:- start:386 stop:541 length:156 start_codon:yes stop_codon:yes gene_type:complete
LNKVIKLLIGVGSSEPMFSPSPIKIILISIILSFVFLLIVTTLIIITGTLL